MSRVCLDVGCGTGIVGYLLNPFGFTAIDGVDATPVFLEKAKDRGHYKELHELWLGRGVDEFPAEMKNKYDLVLGSGVFLSGHFPKAAYEDMIAATKPGGLIVFGIRDCYWVNGEELGFKDKVDELITQGKLEQEPVF